MGFKDKVVIVTGSGAGIGRQLAVELAAKGAKLVINSTKESTGAETLRMVKDAGAEAIFVRADVSEPEDAKRIVDEAVKAFGRVDVLYNVAGVVLGGTIWNTTVEDFDRTMDVNVRGTMLMMQYAVPKMQKQGGGAIVNTASVAATKGLKNRVAYSASKGAVLSMSRAVAAELVRENIRVNVVSPGTTLTPSLEDRIRGSADPDQAMKDFCDRQPIGRLGAPSEIVKAYLFAADDEAGFLDGVNIAIDGGMSI